MGARGVRRVDEPAVLEEAVADAVRFSRSGRVIIEELIEGPEFSIDALMINGVIHVCGIADRHIRFPPYFIEIGHTMPTTADDEAQRAVAAVLERAARALGIENGAAKGDIFLTDRGAVVGEVAARLSGGYMSGWTYPYASGVPLTEAGMRIALGLEPGDLTPRRGWTSAERASVSIPGRLQEVTGLDTARSMPYVEELFERAAVGEEVTFPRNNTEKCANVISAAPERDTAVSAAEEAIASMVFRLAPGDARTERFLAAPGAPAAFTLERERNRRALAGMPEVTGYAGGAEAGGRGSGGGSSGGGTSGGAGAGGSGSGGILVPARSVEPLRAYLPLPETDAEEGRDWNHRSIRRTLDMLETMTGVRPARPGEAGHGRRFWGALLKGGLQGALFYLDTIDRAKSRRE
jgi:uncharacterized membrane protein YgcG